MAKASEVSSFDLTVSPGADFVPGLGLFDSVMVVVGVMIGSGIFIVSADMARQIGSPGGLLIAWVFTGILTIAGALSYGELSSAMPHVGGMYVYLREAFSPLCGFLYGRTLFTVIQQVPSRPWRLLRAILWRPLAEDRRGPLHNSSPTHFIGLRHLTVYGSAPCRRAHHSPNLDQQPQTPIRKTCTELLRDNKVLALLILIVVGLVLGWNATTDRSNSGNLWIPRGYSPIVQSPAV